MMDDAASWIGLSALMVFPAFDLGRCPRLGWGRAVGAGDGGRNVGGGEFGDEGGEEVRGGGAGSGELRFQRVHQGHQLLHFGHDPALFGEGCQAVVCFSNN
jgi:hypothetical protein